MCGIFGIIGPESRSLLGNEQRPLECLRHRGPDGFGIWKDLAVPIILGHARLAVLDLSPTGAQPMLSECGSWVITFNGEIYNHLQLRQELDAISPRRWRGTSDTETLVEAIAQWGVAAALARMRGMFAFGAWHRVSRKLWLARDRFGEKPLYYAMIGQSIAFASELSALKAVPGFDATIDRQALAVLLRQSCIPAPLSIYQRARKLPAASMLIISFSESGAARCAPATEWWSLQNMAAEGLSNRNDACTLEEASHDLEKLLREVVSEQMVADVPIGAMLSGGIDSSVLCALMQDELQTKFGTNLRTFTIGFENKAFDESGHAKAVAKHIGSDHTELIVSEMQALEAAQEMCKIYSEPFADSSQIPTVLVSRLARKQITVAISGDGGDELFGGYKRYTQAETIWRALSIFPVSARQLLAGVGMRIPSDLLELAGYLTSPRNKRHNAFADKFYKVMSILPCNSEDDVYLSLIETWREQNPTLRSGPLPRHVRPDMSSDMNAVEKFMFMDTAGYLSNDILAKVDRAAMSTGLETRVPFLDVRVAEFAWRLPYEMRISKGVGKRVVREVLKRYVPNNLIDRPKMGFGIPLHEWLRGPLFEWADALLDERRLQSEGFFDAKIIRKFWNEHQSGRRRWGHYLWNILMFQAWMDEQD